MTKGAGLPPRPDPANESPEWIPEAIAQAVDVVFVTDRQNRIIYISSAVAGLLGMPPASLVGDTILSLVAPDDHAAMLDGLYEARTGGQGRELIEIAWTAPGRGELVPVEIALQRVVIDEAVKGCVGIARDISGRDERLKARLASERVAAVSELAQQTANDINNPLAILTVYLGVIEKAVAEGKPPTSEAVEQMRDVANRIADVIRDLSTMADTTIQKSILGTPVADLASPPRANDDQDQPQEDCPTRTP